MVFLSQSWEPTDAEGHLYALFYSILYKGLENPRGWRGTGTNPLWIPREGCLGGVKSYTWLLDCSGSAPLTSMLFKSQLYMICRTRSGKALKEEKKIAGKYQECCNFR